MQVIASTNFAEKVEALTRRRIDIFDGAGDDWRFAESLKSISEDTAQEYEGRALVELVQNGHDALKFGPGRISIILDLDQSPGVLYVANDGAPFTHGNFKAITEFALSDKGAGEGIGNKGLGFRSVLQLTDWPEVYSKAQPDSATFDGYCFRFATPSDIEVLIGPGDLLDRVVAEVSPLALPVPAAPQDSSLTALARAGYSTVVRLPLRGQPAADAAREQLEALRSAEAPLLLFLERVLMLTAETRAEAGVEVFELIREEVHCALAPDGGGWISEVRLGDCGRYLLARRPLDPRPLADAVAASVALREIDEKWHKWDCEDAWVGLALRLDEPLKAGRLYTFLPMSEGARSPLAAHAHAPFFTKLARLSMSESVPLNDYLMRELAILAARLLRCLRDGAAREAAAGLVLDLACWDPHGRLDDALGGALKDEAIVPLLGGRGWANLDRAFDWADTSRPWHELTAPALAALGVDVLDAEAVGEARRARLRALHQAVTERAMDPSAETLARWCEMVAGALPSPDRGEDSLPRWAAYYDDLQRAFTTDAAALHGRYVVLDSAGTLRAALGGADPREDTIFFSPELTDPEAPARVPSRLRALRSRLAFTHPEIPWIQTARAFLETSGLVREYRTHRVLDALRELLAKSKSDALRRDALEFASRQFPSLNATQRTALRAVGFFVPRADGVWVHASAGLLSPEWDADGARRLQRCLAAGGDAVNALARQRDRWIAPPEAWPHPVADSNKYRAFLEAVGVRDGLALTVLPNISDRQGNLLMPNALARQLGVSAELTPGWSSDVAARWSGGNHPYTQYGFTQRLTALPGAAETAALGSTARREYAELVIRGMGTWPESAFAVTVFRRSRPTGQQDRRSWPTPLASALRHLPWLPVIEDGVLGFRRPDQAWYLRDGDLPPFVPAMPRGVRMLLSGDSNSQQRAEAAGLRCWDDPRHAAAAVRELAAALEDGVVPDHLSASYKKEYARALTQAAASGTWPWTQADASLVLAADRDGRLEPIRPAHDEALYLPDVHDPLKQSLVELAGHPVLVSDPEAGETIGALMRAHGLRVIALSEIDVKVFSGGELVLPEADLPLLVDDRDWLIPVVAAVLELKSSTFVRRRTERTLRSLLARLRAIRVARLPDVVVSVGGPPAAPAAGVRSVPLADGDHPTIAVWGTDGDWDELQACAGSLAHLLSQPYLHDALELALIKLERLMDGLAPQSLDDDVLARVLDTTVARVQEVRFAVAGDLDEAKRRLRPIAVYVTGLSGAHGAAEQVDACQTEQAVEALVTDLAPMLGAMPADVMTMLRQAVLLDELRDALGLDFAAFNQALDALGPPYLPLVHPELHEVTFSRYLDSVAESVLDRLRERYHDDALAGRPVDGYVAGRRLEGLAPDEAWLPLCRVPSVDQMREQVRRWLRIHDAADDLDAPSQLPPVEETRIHAVARLEAVMAHTAPLVRAWARKNGVEIPPGWEGTPLVEASFALENSGLADLIELTDDRLLAIAASGGGWPAGMPIADDLAALDLTDDDVRTAHVDTGTTENRPARRATIRLGAAELPVGTDNLTQIAEAALRSIDPAFLKQSGRTELAELPSAIHRDGGRGRGRSAVVRNAGLTEDQRTAVGLVGEVTARAWLSRRHREVRWRSGYAAIVNGDPEASDGLGYDFEVAWRSTTLMIEVKALVAEPGVLAEFELGESEVRAAQAAARSDRYRILLVTQALDPAERRIHQLPNPFSARGLGRFRVAGKGLRYQCTLM